MGILTDFTEDSSIDRLSFLDDATMNPWVVDERHDGFIANIDGVLLPTSRGVALEIDCKAYFGTKCKKGHTIRNSFNGGCRKCNGEQTSRAARKKRRENQTPRRKHSAYLANIERNKKMFDLYQCGMTMTEIGKIFGLAPNSVGQNLKKFDQTDKRTIRTGRVDKFNDSQEEVFLRHCQEE